MSNSSNSTGLLDIIDGGAGVGQNKEGIPVKAFVLNIAVGLGLFAFELSGFFLLKNAAIGRRLYQPKTYLVQDRLRVEAIPANPIAWIKRIFNIQDEELKTKCGLDGYFFIRFIRAMMIIFVPLMVIVVTVLLPINYDDGKSNNVYLVAGKQETYNVTGLDTLSWQNVAPTHTQRYWAHLLCAILAISWSLYRMYREKLNFIDVRQKYLTSPEHRLKASARTVLITNIPSEYRSVEALKALYDVFVDNDDRSRLTVWVNRDYGSLRTLVARRRKLRHALEKEELKILRLVNKKYLKSGEVKEDKRTAEIASQDQPTPENENENDHGNEAEDDNSQETISTAFEGDCHEETQLWHRYLQPSYTSRISLIRGKDGRWVPASSSKFWASGEKKVVPKIAWQRAEIARLTVQIEDLLPKLDDESLFKKQNSAFIQFDRQMAAHMACSLVSHHLSGRMAPRFLEVAPHEVIWPNMGVTSRARVIRTCIAIVLFLAMLVLWGLPITFLGILSQLDSLRGSTSYLVWLQPWPSWIISLISGPLTSILLALLVQLVVPALSRKLAVLVGTPTRSKREVVTQSFYFTFLFIELVLVTSISSGVVTVIPTIISNPVNVPSILATNLPRAANYFFNYLIVQSLGYSGSVLFQYLRILYITTIWPWFTQTPREEAWLQTTIPHQMWANVYGLTTNFAVIGLIYSIISPLMLIFVSITFSVFWVAYRHNYYYVQRNKVDTHGLLFNNAISQLFAGVYVLEIALIGLFFLVRDTDNNVVCTPQGIIMIVILALTAAYHFIMEQHLRPLYEFLPVTLEDAAVDAERERFLVVGDADEDDERPLEKSGSGSNNSIDIEQPDLRPSVTKESGPADMLDGSAQKSTNRMSRIQMSSLSATAANARKSLSKLKRKTAARVTDIRAHVPEGINKSRRREVADLLSASIARYPDELTDLSHEEQQAELRAAFQDPVTREPPPIIWIPQDPAGIADDTLMQVQKYGRFLQYSNTGAYLTNKNKCEVTQPAPDIRPDWLLDWVL